MKWANKILVRVSINYVVMILEGIQCCVDSHFFFILGGFFCFCFGDDHNNQLSRVRLFFNWLKGPTPYIYIYIKNFIFYTGMHF